MENRLGMVQVSGRGGWQEPRQISREVPPAGLAHRMGLVAGGQNRGGEEQPASCVLQGLHCRLLLRGGAEATI